MTVAGIIAEYNPFHRGHAYQIQEARRKAGADFVLAVMSPDFVQRGGVSLLDKWTRAEMALRSGADLVLELPLSYAVSSAEYFAEGGVALLSALGVVDQLVFGCETDRPDLLEKAAAFFSLPREEEPLLYRSLLAQELKKGASYPQARAAAYLETVDFATCSDSGLLADRVPAGGSGQDRLALADLLTRPNNILAIEYLKAIRRLHASLSPFPIRRVGQDYHGVLPEGAGYASATAIRTAVQSGRMDLLPSMLPPSSLSLVLSRVQAGDFLTDSDLSQMLVLRLTEEASQERTAGHRLSAFLDVSEDLAARMKNHLDRYDSFDQFATLLKTRQMTEARIRRALTHILLDLRQEEMDRARAEGSAFYARVLGFRKEAAPLLHRIKKESGIPLISNLPDALGREASGLTDTGRSLLLQTVYGSRVRGLALQTKTGRRPISEYRRQPVIIDS